MCTNTSLFFLSLMTRDTVLHCSLRLMAFQNLNNRYFRKIDIWIKVKQVICFPPLSMAGFLKMSVHPLKHTVLVLFK